MHFLLVASFLVLSGVASLTYQVTWVRLLGLSMGSTSASISTVLAAFFLGMAIGSYLAERITRNNISSLRPYIILELLIGISGLSLLPILLNLDGLLAIIPALGAEISLKFIVTMVLLSIPTMCMGATFPVMASILIRNKDEIGLRMSQLYSLNTAGAVLGAALTGFVFIPNWGLDGAIYIAFALNMAIVAMALYANKNFTSNINNARTASAPDLHDDVTINRTRAIAALALTGFISIATQVGWTKYLSIFTGTTIYGFSAILTIFLSGIAIGSWAIKSRLETIKEPQLWMAIGLLLLGTSLIFTRVGLASIPELYKYIISYNPLPEFNNPIRYAIVFVMLFIPTFILGALFPLNLKLYCGTLNQVRTRIGKAYSINTIASIFGALFAGLFFIPVYGTDALLTLMASATLLLSLIFLTSSQKTMSRIAISASVLIALFVAIEAPHLSYKSLIASIGYAWDEDVIKGKEPEFLFVKEGKAGVITMVTYDNVVAKLQSNGLNESMINMQDQNKTLLAETLLGILPYTLHKDPKSAFVVGFGGGITTRALTLTDISSIRIVELEPAVVEADRRLYSGEIPALQDPRVKIDFNDARNTLLVENKTYDLIVAQPSHPWLAGAANVFTQQFWEITKSRLNHNGIFGQWVNLFKMDVTTLKSLFKAFYQVYPHGFSFANLHTGDLILIGSKEPIIFDYARMEKILAKPEIRATLSTHEIHTPSDLLWYFALSRNEAITAAADARPNTDTNILSEVRLSALTSQPEGDEDPYAFLRRNFHLDLAPYLGDNVADKLYAQADYYFFWNDSVLAMKAAEQLKKLDPVRGRGIEYELAWRAYDVATATKLYNQHQQWPDRTHKQHALLLAKNGEPDKAWATFKKIEDSTISRIAYAQLLYITHDWERLSTLQAKSPEEKKWQLLAASNANLNTAGAALDKIELTGPDDLPQMLVLLEYYSSMLTPDAYATKQAQLTKTVQAEIERLQYLVDNDVPKEDKTRIKVISDLISEMSGKIHTEPEQDKLQTNSSLSPAPSKRS